MTFLHAEQVCKRYAAHTALENLDLAVPRQSIFGLLGPNGAGKSTLIRIIMQIIRADSGRITVEGQPLQPAHAGTMGYLPEERGLYKKMKVAEQLLYLARLKGMKQADAGRSIKQWLEKFNMLAWAGSNVDTLSKGMQQKIQFIATVVHRPTLVILDEPFSGFDPVNAQLLTREILALRDQGATIILSTHRMESVESLCDHIVLIHKARKVLEGPVRDVRSAYGANTYVLGHRGVLPACGDGFRLLKQVQPEADCYQSVIALDEGFSTRQLIDRVNGQVEIREFRELLPSIHDIFIAETREREVPAAPHPEPVAC